MKIFCCTSTHSIKHAISVSSGSKSEEPVERLRLLLPGLLEDLRREMGLTTLLITHDMAVVHETADRVAVMYQGRIVEHGTAADVLSNPTNDYTARLLAAAPRFGDGAPVTEDAR